MYVIKFLEYYQICPSNIKYACFIVQGILHSKYDSSRKCLNKYNVLSSILKIRNDIIYYNS